MSSNTPLFPSRESQQVWRQHVHSIYTSNHGIRPCVFWLPDSHKQASPQAYTPQFIALGPYHHFDPQVQVMETKKRDAVGDYLQSHTAPGLTDFITQAQLHNTARQEELEPIIRHCYDRYLDLDNNTLLLITILDAIVLLHFLRTCLGPEHRKHAVYSNLDRLVPDVFMLENQIPVILIHATCNSLASLIIEEARLSQGFHRFCTIHSPLPLTPHKDEAVLSESFRKSSHLLHFIYLLIVNHKNPQSLDFDTYCHGQSEAYSGFKPIRSFADGLYEAHSSAGVSHTTVYWTGTNSGLKETPSVYNLRSALQMKFIPLPESCGIEDIGLNTQKNKLYLPVIRMGANSEVILRNLVAYEAAAQQETPIRDFLNLLCGLVKSKTDLRYLKEAGIIKGELSDLEILKICHGLHNSDEKPDDNNSKAYSVIKKVNIQFENAMGRKFLRWNFKFTRSLVLLFRILKILFKNIKELVTEYQTTILVITGFFVGVRSNGIALGYQNPDAGGAAARDTLIFGLDHPQTQAAAEVLMLPRKLLPYQSHLPY